VPDNIPIKTDPDPSRFKIGQDSDGCLYLEYGEDQEMDLVFVSAAVNGDPFLEEQRKMLQFILRAIKNNQKE